MFMLRFYFPAFLFLWFYNVHVLTYILMLMHRLFLFDFCSAYAMSKLISYFLPILRFALSCLLYAYSKAIPYFCLCLALLYLVFFHAYYNFMLIIYSYIYIYACLILIPMYILIYTYLMFIL